MGWAEMRDRMHERVVAHLNDGCAQYQGPGGAPAQSGVTVIIDRNLMQNGPEGMFRSDAVGVSWRKCQLATVERGGIFTYCGERLLVADVIADDGHMVTAACMVQP
jgi:hypothetical protein